MFALYITLYNIILYIIQPIIWIRLLLYSIKNPHYRGHWLERYGFYSKSVKYNGIILHAVSLGEMLIAIPLVYSLQKHYPNLFITLTTTTPTGLKIALSKFNNQNNIQCVYLPYDLPNSIKRFINYTQPKLMIVMETELWPNLINILYKRNIPFIVANARLSLRSFIKYKKIKSFFYYIVKRITLVAAQNKDEGKKFIMLGLKKNKLLITGNLKFDITITQKLLHKILFLKKKTWLKERKIWIVSSTHAGEEEILLQTHKNLLVNFPNLLMILTPRHPERCAHICNIIKKIGFSYCMQSNIITSSINTTVVINDTIGELMLLYGISDIAFIGGSLVRNIGGHNPLEAAIYGIPLIMGPYTSNFYDICIKLYKIGGLITIYDSISLTNAINTLLTDQNRYLDYGKRAAEIFKNNKGSTLKLLQSLDYYLSDIKK